MKVALLGRLILDEMLKVKVPKLLPSGGRRKKSCASDALCPHEIHDMNI